MPDHGSLSLWLVPDQNPKHCMACVNVSILSPKSAGPRVGEFDTCFQSILAVISAYNSLLESMESGESSSDEGSSSSSSASVNSSGSGASPTGDKATDVADECKSEREARHGGMQTHEAETWEEHVRKFGSKHQCPRCRFMRLRQDWMQILTYTDRSGIL